MKKYIFLSLSFLFLFFSCKENSHAPPLTELSGTWVSDNSEKENFGFISIAGDSLLIVPSDGSGPHTGKISPDPSDNDLQKCDYGYMLPLLFKINSDTLYLKKENQKEDLFVKYIRFEPGNTVSEIHGKDADYLKNKVMVKENESEVEYLFPDTSNAGLFPYSMIIDKKEGKLRELKSYIHSFFKLNNLSVMHYVKSGKGSILTNSYVVVNISPDTLSVIPIKSANERTIHYTLMAPFKAPFKFNKKFLETHAITVNYSLANDAFNRLGIRVGTFSGKQKNAAQNGRWFLTPDKKRLVLYIAPFPGDETVNSIINTIEVSDSDYTLVK